MAGFFTPGIGPTVCIQSVLWPNPPARLVAEPGPGPRQVDAWTVARVSHAGRPGPWPVIRGPLALAGGYLVRA
jgi:hypothetical protein